MKKISILFAALLSINVMLQAQEAFVPKVIEWQKEKFGLFIHWGPSSITEKEISWSKETHPFDHPGRSVLHKTPDHVYNNLYKKFNPVDFDAEKIVKTAKQAGMKYIIFTTKHHDGFSNFHTKLSEYSIEYTPYQKDICKELADACKKHGLKIGWYYSTRDWYHPDYLVGDNKKYDDFYIGQIRELLTNYGEIFCLWFDHTAGDWTQYDFKGLFKMIYELQPNIVVNNRAAKFIKKELLITEPSEEVAKLVKGDFYTPEGKIGIFDSETPWESCMPMSKGVNGRGGWSYLGRDAVTFNFNECTQMLGACASGCGNLLLNVGPMSNGKLRPSELEVLQQFKPWMKKYKESVFGTECGPYISGQWGGACHKGNNTVYLHIYKWANGQLTLPALPRKVLSCEGLGEEKVSYTQTQDALTIKIANAQKKANPHVVVKLTLEEGASIDLIPTEEYVNKTQFDALEDPMN